MRRPDPAARAVLRSFAETDRRTRWHTAIRWRTCPFDAVAALLPEEGTVLDYGCGHGHFSMYLARTAAGRRVLGVDIDAAKVDVGSRVVADAGLADRVELRCVDSGWLPDPASVDAVVTNDVLYLLGDGPATAVLGAMVAAVRPGGVVVVKEMADHPRWKVRVNATQERLATGVLGLTQGAELAVLPLGRIEAPMRAAGLAVRTVALDGGYPHPHAAVVGDRP